MRSVKELLRRMLGTAKITRRQLESCLASVSCTINNRPLTTLTEDQDDLIPLTPFMFMRDLPIPGLPERELMVSKDYQEGYRKLQMLKKGLKERFRKEYLSNLVQHRSENCAEPPEVGDVVLVGQDNKKRFCWPLGRIVELYPGKDGICRVAKVKTRMGTLVRPTKRLYPLEVPNAKKLVSEHQKDSIVGESKEDDEFTVIKKTRSGREVKVPSRYGQWNK